MKNVILVLSAGLFVSMAYASTEIECISKGKTTANLGQMLPTNSELTFVVAPFNVKKDTIMKILDVRGTFRVGREDGEVETMNDENSFVGEFSIDSLESNPSYHPHKYKNMLQFQNFNASNPTGAEDEMMGQLLIDKRLGKRFDANYLFLAGERMGGTMHFSCHEVE